MKLSLEERAEADSILWVQTAEAWNARKPITVLHRGSDKKNLSPMNASNEEECKELVVTEGRKVRWY